VTIQNKVALLKIRLHLLIHGKPLWLKHPLTLQFDTQTRCNLRCIYCNPQNSYIRKHGVLPLSTFNRVLQYVKRKRWVISYVMLYMNGEPLLESRLNTLAFNVHAVLGVKVIVFTNGSVTEHRNLLVSEYIDEVHFTVSAASRSTYLKVHGKDLFDETLKNVVWFRRNKMPNQEIIINFIQCKENVGELEDWKRLFKDYKHEIRPLHESKTQVQSSKAADAVKLKSQWRSSSNSGFHSKNYSNKRPCPTFSGLHVSYDGKVMHCCDADYRFNYGSVLERDIEEMWREKVAAGVNCEACAGCTLKSDGWRRP